MSRGRKARQKRMRAFRRKPFEAGPVPAPVPERSLPHPPGPAERYEAALLALRPIKVSGGRLGQ